MNAAATMHVAAVAGVSVDEALVFQGVDTALLVAAVGGRIDLLEMAKQELASRGLNQQGVWVGFDAASAQISS